MPHSLFHFDSSPSFSLPLGMDMNQAAIMNPMMQPVPILGQQSFSAFEPDTRINDSISRQTRQTRRLNQRFDDEPTSRILDFGQGILDLLKNNNFGETSRNTQRRDSTAQNFRELDRLMEEVQPGSPQANFLAAREAGNLTQQQIDDANAFAASMGTTFDPNLGYSRTPFLDSLETLRELDMGQDPRRAMLLERFPVQGITDEFRSRRLAEDEEFGAPANYYGKDATRAMLLERFGAPTISSILNLPSGQGMGMMIDAQGRMISPGDDRTAFDQASLNRLARLGQRDVRPGETLQERDTRIADSRTEGADQGGEMTFEEARKFVPRGQREKVKSYNERIRAFQAQQNSIINKLKEEYERYRVQGEIINNARLQGLAVQYQQTEPEKYRETVQIAEEMLRDGILQDEIQAAMYVVQTMGGKVSDIFKTGTPSGSTSPMIDQIIQAGQQGGSSSQKSLDDQAYDYAINNPNDPRSQQILDRLGRK